MISSKVKKFDKEIVRKRLREEREKRYSTQEDLKTALEDRGFYYSPTSISGMENPKTSALPRLDVLWELAELYGVSIDYLVGHSDHTSQEIEDIGKPLGLSEKSVIALLFLSGNDYQGILKKHYGKDLKYIDAKDRKDLSENLEVINLVLEALFDDIEISRNNDVNGKRTPFSTVLDNFFIPMYEYLFSSGINYEEFTDEDGNVFDRVCERVNYKNDDFFIPYNMRNECEAISLKEVTDTILIKKMVSKLNEYRKKLKRKKREEV
jgi:transcriptional regulator with XRE-family HTH domain